MGWDKTIPNEDNVVRGVSGDLALVRENFETLDPIVVSGLNGLSGVDTAGAVSGQALTYSGGTWVPSTPVQSLSGLEDTAVSGAVSGQALAYKGGGLWGPETISGGTQVSGLDDLDDVDTTGAVSGDKLTYDGNEWVPLPDATTSGARAAVMLSGAQVIPDNVLTQVSGTVEAYNVGGWTISGGALIVPSGITRINAQGQVAWESTATAFRQFATLYLNGSPMSGLEGYGLDPANNAYKGTQSQSSMRQVMAMDVPVAGGDALTLHVLQDNTGSSDMDILGVGSTGATYLLATEAGGSSWGPSTVDRAMLVLSGNFSSSSTPTTVTGMQQTVNVGGWATQPASGIIEVPSGISLVEVRAQATWDSSDAGSWYEVALLKDGSTLPLASGTVSERGRGSSAGAKLNFGSWALAVSGGEQLAIQVVVDADTPSVVSGETWFEVRAVNGGGGGGGGAGSFTADAYIYMADVAPVSGTVYDDEFTGPTVTGAGGNWTTWDPGSVGVGTSAGASKAGALGLSINSTGSWAGIYRNCAALSGADYCFTVKLGVTRRGSPGDEAWAGLAFFDQLSGNESTAGCYVGCLYHMGDSIPARIGLYQLSNYADTTPTIIGTDELGGFGGTMGQGGVYLRMTWDFSSSAILFTYSTDGRSWAELASVIDPGWAPSEVALIGWREAGSDHLIRAPFFRMRESSYRGLSVSGAEIAVQYA